MQSYSQSKSIPTFKLHRVIITILGRNVKFLIHFFSFFFGEKLAVLGELAFVLMGLGTKIWVQVKKDLFFMDERNLKIIFAGV